MHLKGYQNLLVWQKAVDLVEAVYRITRTFPKEELYGLVSQMRRAVVSIPGNIAEGSGRSHRGDYLNHLSIARGSLLELETHLIIAFRLEYADKDNDIGCARLCQEVGAMLHNLIQSLQVPSKRRQTPQP